MKIRVKQNVLKAVALIVCVCLIIVGGLLLLKSRKQQILYQKTSLDSAGVNKQVCYNDIWYEPKEGLETILVMGLDKFEHAEQEAGYLNNEQSDFLMVLALDKKNQQCDILHLNRDTMTEIQRLGVGGGAAGTFTGQLALAHTFGSGGSDSCLNTTKAVSKLLGGVKIDHYLSVTMDAVAKVNDLVGGVEVEIMDDFSQIDPQMVQGEKVRLTGEQALLYVRTRMGLEDSSNLHRMERQRQYMDALYQKTMECKHSDPSFMKNVFLEISGSFQSDYSVNQLEKLFGQMEEYTVNPIRTLEGKAVKGAEFMEFYVNEDAKQRTAVELFYQPVKESE